MEVQTRMVRQLDCLADAHSEETVAVVSHGDPLRSVIAYYLGIPLDLLLRFEISPASVSVVEQHEWGPRVLCLNETGDVPAMKLVIFGLTVSSSWGNGHATLWRGLCAALARQGAPGCLLRARCSILCQLSRPHRVAGRR